jgi:hypothetical protein
MNILGRDGNISIIRIGTLAAILGILIILGGVVLFFVDRASHQVPLEIAPYPGSTEWYRFDRSNTSQSIFFRVPAVTAEEVAVYYQQKLTEFYGTSEDRCVRNPFSGNYPEYDQGVPNIAPYQISCMFDRSGFQVSQYTRINIQPGVVSNGSEGMIIIEHEQTWQS